MSRWEALLDALGVSSATFELEQQAKFDLNPREWVQERLKELRKEGETLCSAPCCEKMS